MKSLSIAFLMGSLVLSGCGGDQEQAADSTLPPVAEPLSAEIVPESPETESGATLAVVLEDNTIGLPAQIPAGPVVLTVRNAGQQLHTLSIEGETLQATLENNLATGETGNLALELAPGTYRAFCPLHADSGVESVEFAVEGPVAPPAAGS